MKPPPHAFRLLRPFLRPTAPSTSTTTTTRSIRLPSKRHFSSTPRAPARNRIYEPIRSLPALSTTLSLSTTASRPLLALFTLSTSTTFTSTSIFTSTPTPAAPTSRIRALLLQLLEREGVGERDGGVGFAEVELDAPDCVGEDVGALYAITSIPTLMAFSRGEPQRLTKLTDTAELQDREFLTLWIENEARRGGAGGAGGGFFGGIFGLGSS